MHGLAVASTLAELGLRSWERVASIFAFSAGTDVMRLLVIVCTVPSLVLLDRTRFYTPFRLTGAVFAAAAASVWIAKLRHSTDPSPSIPL